MKNLLYNLFLVLMLSSCGAKYITIVDQVLPAEKPFPSDIRSVVVVDRARPANLGSSSQQSNIGNNTTVVRNCAGRLPLSASVLPQGQYMSVQGAPAPPLSPAEVNNLSRGTQGVFSLDQLFFGEERRTVEYDKHQLDENGYDYYIKAIRGTKLSSLDALWRLYDGRSGEVLMEFPYALEDFFEAEGLNYQSVNAKLDTMHQVNPDAMARTMVDQLIAEVTPTPIESNWLYYTKGNDLVKRSADYMEAGRYDAAARLIQQNSRKIVQMKRPERAQMNWATALFLDGDIAGATQVARDGYSQFRDQEFLTFVQKISAY